MPRKKKASNSTGLGDLKAVISKAAAVYPQLIARRDALHAELREIEEILGAFGGGSAKAAPAPAKRRGRPPKAASGGAKRAGRPPRGDGSTVAEIVRGAIAKSSSALSASQIVAAVHAVRPGSSPGGIQMVLRKLRDDGVIKATGKRRSYRYSLSK